MLVLHYLLNKISTKLTISKIWEGWKLFELKNENHWNDDD